MDKFAATWNTLKEGNDIIKIYDKPEAVLVLHPDGASINITNLLTNKINNPFALNPDSQGVVNLFSPKVILDRSTDKFLYYDIPGFGNIRDPSMEITSTYFIKEVIDRVRALKFILIMDYLEAQRPESEDFVNLIKQASQLIQNIDSFKNSIFLVVTNAKDIHSNDKTKINSILTNTKSTISENPNATKLIDIFLTNASQVGILHEENSSLKNLIRDDQTFVSFADDDFKFDVSQNAQGRIFKMSKGINEDIPRSVNSLVSKIRNHYIAKQEEFQDIRDVDDILDVANQQVQNTVNFLETENMYPREFGETLEVLFRKLNIPLAQGDLIKITTQNLNLQCLRKLDDEHTKTRQSDWIAPLMVLLQELEVAGHWSSFLLRTRDRLLEYDVQRDKVKYNPTRLQQLLSNAVARSETQKRPLKGQDLQYFFKEIFNQGDMLGYDSIKTLDMDEIRLKMIRRIINTSFDDDKNVECNSKSKELLIKGNFLKTSEIKWDTGCQGVENIKIFAIKKIFIDSDIEETIRGKRLTIISPTWVVVGARKIILNNSEFFGVGYTFLKGIGLRVNSNDKSMTNLIELFETSHIQINGLSETEDFRHRQTAAINQYKVYQMIKLHDLVDKVSTLRMNDELYNNEKILRLYDFQGFIDEIFNLERTFQFDFKTNPKQSYESLLKRIIKYYKDMKTKSIEIPPSEDLVLKYAYTLCSSKVWSLKNNLDNNLIIHIEDHLDDVLTSLKELKNNQKILQVMGYVHNYKNTIQFDIDDLLDFMNKHILPYIENTEKEIDEEIKRLIEEVKQMQDDKRKDIRKLKAKQRELKNAFKKKSFLKVLGGVGKVVSFFGPVGQMVGGLINVGTSVADSFITQPDASLISKVKSIPPAVKNAVEIIEKFTRQREAKNREALDQKIETLLQVKDPDLGVIIDKLISVRNKSTGKFDPKEVDKIFNKAKEDLEKSSKPKTKIAKTIELFNKVQAFSPVIDVVKDLYSSAQEYQRAKDELSAAIQLDEQQINQLEIFKQQIDDVLITGFTDTKTYVSDVAKDLSQGVRVPMVERWTLQLQVSQIKKQMQKFSDGFTVNAELMECWDKIDNALSHLNNAYDKIQDLQKDKKLSDLIAQVGSQGIDGSIPLDKALNEKILQMILFIQYNVVCGKYNRIVRALKQATFPFADFYFWLDNFPGNTDSIQYMIASLTDKMTTLKSTLAESRTSTVKPNHLTYLAEFSSRSVLNNPFYLWTNQENRNLIGRLLRGEEIVLVADVTKSRLQNGVKFNKIELLFNHKNQTIQNEIDTILSTFEIQLLHSGVSRYKCENQVYTFVSNPQSLSYSYARALNHFSNRNDICFGIPAIRKETYDKLSEAKPILSPYTAWTIKLRNLRYAGYDDLIKYQDQIDLELAGTGSFVDNQVKVCDDQLINQYTVDRDFSEKLYVRESFFTTKKKQRSHSPRYTREINNSIDSNQSNILLAEYPHQGSEKMNPVRGNYSQFDNYHGSVMLLELFARKCTGQKQEAVVEVEDQSKLNTALIESINVVDKFERKLGKLFEKYKMKKIRLDPCDLVRRFKSNLLNGNGELCHGILRDSVTSKPSKLNMEQFYYDLDKIIDKSVAKIKFCSG